ncbi:MAG: PQQ-like beta-propeller repeat protein [Lentisphaerae bacterium]|nr:PQQ-like beta-propeller repeat protein [Lentisphaerota bacterium]
MTVHRQRIRRCVTSALALWFCGAAMLPAADWPMYQHDMRRSAITEEQLPLPLSAQWVFTPPYPPENAWSDPQPKVVEGLLELPRMRFDDAFHLVAAADKLFFGASSDNKVYALDAATGDVAWEFYTDAPVRMAPTVWENRVYAGSDDGKVYCLKASDGSLVWAFQAAPSDEMVLSSGRMASLWPIRTGVIVVNEIAYFGAGVFPAEGLFLYALNARTGAKLWCNDTYGRGGNVQISPQGYMVASRTTLFLPSGRSIPAAFSRENGRFLFHRNQSWRSVGQFGGCYAFLADDLLFNGTEQIMALKAKDGGLLFSEDARLLVVAEDSAYLLTGKEIVAVDRKKWREVSRKRRSRSRG